MAEETLILTHTDFVKPLFRLIELIMVLRHSDNIIV